MATGWQEQPRNAATGRWQCGEVSRRCTEIKIRCSEGERVDIYAGADAQGVTVTAYIIGCCQDYARHRIPHERMEQHREIAQHRLKRRG